jgi:hypothetical protein
MRRRPACIAADCSVKDSCLPSRCWKSIPACCTWTATWITDEFYDRRVKRILSAFAGIESLYRGRKLAFEFRRTVSRLAETQSADYLHAAHLS